MKLILLNWKTKTLVPSGLRKMLFHNKNPLQAKNRWQFFWTSANSGERLSGDNTLIFFNCDPYNYHILEFSFLSGNQNGMWPWRGMNLPRLVRSFTFPKVSFFRSFSDSIPHRIFLAETIFHGNYRRRKICNKCRINPIQHSPCLGAKIARLRERFWPKAGKSVWLSCDNPFTVLKCNPYNYQII